MGGSVVRSFHYTAIRPAGGLATGVVRAPSADHVVRDLGNEGVIVVSIAEARQYAKTPESFVG